MSGAGAVSRRELLSGGFLRLLLIRPAPPPPPAAVAPLPGAERQAEAEGGPASAHARRRPRFIPVLRPPGAIAEDAFLSRCTRCGDCAAACPHGAIVPAPARMRGAAGSPMIDPARQPCLLCEGQPCIAACGPGALLPTERPRMGTASIDTLSCLAHQGSFCSTCVERCPVRGAITVATGRPVVDAEVCVGCGVCQHVCPAPLGAARVLPALSRG